MKPEPAVPPTELRRVALETMSAAKFPMFASVDRDQPRLRPVSPVKTEEFTVFVASMRSSSKTDELERNSKVELCYLSERHDQVRITGRQAMGVTLFRVDAGEHVTSVFPVLEEESDDIEIIGEAQGEPGGDSIGEPDCEPPEEAPDNGPGTEDGKDE